MKRFFAILTVTVCMFVLVSCGQDQDKSDEGNLLAVNSGPVTVLPDDCDSRGFINFICERTDTYTFNAVNKGDEKVMWAVYVMDEEFEEPTRYISESCEPALEGDGELEIRKGQFVYVNCSANGFTCDGDLPQDAFLEINLK